MSAVQYDREALSRRLAPLPVASRVLFSLLCSERLRVCCWAFAWHARHDVSAYEHGLALVTSHLLGTDLVSPQRLREAIAAVDQAVPRSDDFGYPLASQAQAAMVALLCALEDLQNDEPLSSTEAAEAVVEALDNFEAESQLRLSGVAAIHDDYPLLAREVQWHLQVLSALESRASLSLPELTRALRLGNRNFVVPPVA